MCENSFIFSFQKELAKMITLEQGKTLADAEGDVFRGLRKWTWFLAVLFDFFFFFPLLSLD